MSTWPLNPVAPGLPSLPAMKPVLAHVTLDHETGHIIRQPAEAIHRHRGHLLLVLERSAAGQVRKVQRSRRRQHASSLEEGWAQTLFIVNQFHQGTNPHFTNGELPSPGCNTTGVAVGGNRRKSTRLQNSFNK